MHERMCTCVCVGREGGVEGGWKYQLCAKRGRCACVCVGEKDRGRERGREEERT